MTSIKSSDLTFSAERKKVSCTELKGFYVLCGPRSITFYLRYTGKKKDEHGETTHRQIVTPGMCSRIVPGLRPE